VPVGNVNAPVASVPTTPENVPVVPDTAPNPPLALNVPVTAAPVDVTATMVVPPLCIFKSPLLSPVVTTPPEPVVIAFIDEAIIVP
jgi:hypothetical protein